MRLRGLEIQGFKSFPDKTKLNFNDGITAVVGPNGSGKSNIADAMRWVMGEQSTKTLRGDKMEDVIFNGTQQRRPQGFAQVQVTIDNRDRALACDTDEVTIARKLYRSGESEYRINGANVRLKDVHMLLMDTGLGKDGYSMIGQGKIAEIVSAKSNQRREIFEEAAGIAKYRYRRLEAQKRLEGAEENLLRLRDILTELEVRVEPLRAQAEKAKQFIGMAEEKKVLEVSLWVQTLEQSREALSGQEDKILLCKGEHDRIQEEIDEVEEEIAAQFERMQRLAVEIDETRARIREQEDAAARCSEQIAVMHNDMAHNEAAVARIEEELAQADASEEELAQRIHTLARERTEKGGQLEALRQKQMVVRTELEQTANRQKQRVATVDALKERRFGLTKSINDVKLSAASSGSLIDETVERLGVLRESAVIKDGNVMRITRESADCAELLETLEECIHELQNARQGVQLKLEGRRTKLGELSKQRQGLEDEVRGRMQKAQLLSDMEKNMEGFQHSVKYIMRQAEAGALRDVYGPISRLLTVPEDYALAVEIALGAAMQNIVVKDEAVGKRAIGMLKETRNGRATFLPVATIRGSLLQEGWLAQEEGFIGIARELVSYEGQFDGVVRQLLGRVVIAQDLDCATHIARRGNYKFRVVTLDGQVLNAGGSMTGGFAAKSAGILSRSKEIDQLRAEARSLQAQADALEAQTKTLREEMGALEAQIAGMDGELTTAQEDRIRCGAEQKQLAQAREEAIRLKEQSATEYDKLTARLEELRARNMSSSELSQNLSAQLEDVARQLGIEGSERELLYEQSAQLSETLAGLNMEILALEKEADGIHALIEQLSGQRENAREHHDALRAQAQACRIGNEDARKRIDETQNLRTQQLAQAQEQKIELERRTTARNGCEARANALRTGEKEIIARREQTGRELARLEEKKAAMQTEYDGIIARLWDEYELTRSQAAELAKPIEDAGQAQRQLAELKNRIKGLGNVNLGAIEEYAEVSERYQFLKSQTDDAQNAREELLRLIVQLTEDMESIFYDHFNQIAANFSQIFAELFGGGKGSLTLTDPHHMLESGIEIHVQPPGKLIENLASLSGGEHALVAIAIYFAILKVRPSPFVLLDEIEAALDDVNVVKYAQYLRTICNRTQFIAITHRRGTMEEADILYGVTMQDEGVSKLLELNVGEIESKLGMK